MESCNTNVWGFDIGKASLGEAVRIGNEFKHVQSLILDEDFADTKDAAKLRRQMRTRRAHKAREHWLEKCLSECGIEVLTRRKVGIVGGKWALISKGDARLEREFAPSDENVCYNSIALRCKLILGHKLESWQVFKALNSAIQHRGYDENLPWKESEKTDSSKDSEQTDFLNKLSAYEREKDELLTSLPDSEDPRNFDFPCFFKAHKMGLWNPERPHDVELRISNHAQKAKGYVIPRRLVEAEFVRLVEMAALQYPKLKNKAMFILYGVAEVPYASLDSHKRAQFGLKRGADSDWTALGQKIPRFDNRIIDKCKLIPRFNVCRIKPISEAKGDEDLLYHDITLALKLLNFRYLKDSEVKSLSFEEFSKLFEIGKSNKHKITKTNLKKFLKSIGAEVLGEDHSSVEQPRQSGRSSFSRPAMRLLKELIFSGRAPVEFYESKLSQITNEDPNKGLVPADLDFIKLMGNCQWGGIFIPDVKTYRFAAETNPDPAASINRLIGSQNDPIVRHRLSFFYERIKALSQKFGTPDKVVLEFVREDFMGKKAKAEFQSAIKKRFQEKLGIAKKLEENGYKTSTSGNSKMLLKFELFQKQKFVCLYTGEPLSLQDLPNLEIEHIVPRSRGGPDAQYNYVLTKESTNKEKGNQTPFEWLSKDPKKWSGYLDRVRSCFKELGGKRCKLLLSKDAEELVEKYTALAETAWISKLAQQIVCMHFGFQFGGTAGQKRVFTVTGNTTARIRGTFDLNKILHNAETDKKGLSFEDIVKQSDELSKKNRKNPKHHALDAMCLCFAPTGKSAKREDIEKILPPEIRVRAVEFFREYMERLMPNKVAVKKPVLEETIYSRRFVNGKDCIVKKSALKSLAYKSGLKPVYSIAELEKWLENNSSGIPQIINPVVRRLVAEFAKTNPSEEEWNAWCETARIPAENGKGSRVIRVLTYVGSPDEYKDLSKDGCGAYRKGKSHKGQIIWQNSSGKYKVAPIYVHSSKKRTMEELAKRPDFKRVAGIFRSNCIVKIDAPVTNNKAEILLPAGMYKLNTIMTSGHAILTDSNGNKKPAININYLMASNMRIVDMKY